MLGIFPQGTSKQQLERRWHRGAARLALVDRRAARARCGMTGTRALPRRTRVRIVVGEPIVVEHSPAERRRREAR